MKKCVFTGSAVAIVTPMFADGSINWDGLGRLIDWQIDAGTDAVVICGTTGESSTMTDDEHISAIRYAVDHVNGRVPVIAGAGSNDTAYAVMLSKEAYSAGADALLHVTPYYNKTSQRGLIRHFETIADATPMPVILYNVPSRTGCDIKPETYLALSKHPNIVAVKEANGSISAAAVTKQLCGDELALYSGNDDQVLPFLALGGLGVISVFANVLPAAMHDICALWFAGKLDECRAMYYRYLPLMNDLFLDVNPIPVKEALNMMGLDAGPARLPLVPMADAAREKLRATLLQAGVTLR